MLYIHPLFKRMNEKSYFANIVYVSWNRNQKSNI